MSERDLYFEGLRLAAKKEKQKEKPTFASSRHLQMIKYSVQLSSFIYTHNLWMYWKGSSRFLQKCLDQLETWMLCGGRERSGDLEDVQKWF